MDKQLHNLPESNVKDKQVIEAEQKKQAQVIGHMMNIPGMFIWKWNANKRLSEENIEKVLLVGNLINVTSTGDKVGAMNYRVDIEPGHLYVQAINKKNAIRKFRAQINRIT